MLIRADARCLPLRDCCVQCVVTSPPYWGLRDYGTAAWEGGAPECDHTLVSAHQKQGATSARIGCANVEEQRNENFRAICGKCGAVRTDNQIGLEATPEAYVGSLRAVFAEVWRVLKDDGTLWLNLGDSYATGKAGRTDYGTGDPTSTLGPKRNGLPNNTRPGPVIERKAPAGLKPKDLVGIPWRVAFALQADGWYLRADIIWHKPNPMPESCKDRPTKSHEYIFLLSKRPAYYYDADAIRDDYADDSLARVERGRSTSHKYADGGPGDQTLARDLSQACTSPNGRNKRTVWTVATTPYSGAHFATFPEALVEPCILAGCPVGGLVLDQFIGSGTVGEVAERLGRRWVGVDLSYQDQAAVRTAQKGLPFACEAQA